MVQIYNKQLLKLLPIRPRFSPLQMLQHVTKIFKVSALWRKRARREIEENQDLWWKTALELA